MRRGGAEGGEQRRFILLAENLCEGGDESMGWGHCRGEVQRVHDEMVDSNVGCKHAKTEAFAIRMMQVRHFRNLP